MKFIKCAMALLAATLGSAIPVANHGATNITNHAAINITNHAATQQTKESLSLPSCTLYETWIHWEYDIWVGGVDDIPGKCGGLWDNLPKVECAVHYKSSCGGVQSTGLLRWHFWTTDLCETHKVETTFEAAMSGYGSFLCDRGN